MKKHVFISPPSTKEEVLCLRVQMVLAQVLSGSGPGFQRFLLCMVLVLDLFSSSGSEVLAGLLTSCLDIE